MIRSTENRLVVNTISQYCKTVINVLLSFYSTNLILNSLGVSDFGIYSLIAGVVAMLSFVNNALITTTQRYLSFYHGADAKEKLCTIFSNSFLLHLVFGLGIVGMIEIIGLFLFDGFFNIPEERIGAARIIYHIVSIILYITFVTAPFRALFIARENIVYVSVVDIMDGIFKVLLAVSITKVGFDKLLVYGGGMLCISLFNLFAYSIYSLGRYEECSVRIKGFDFGYIKELSGFAGWSIYSTGCVVGRTQGVAIVLNKFFGTVINAAFGIALQVSGAVQFVSQSFLNSISPQIIKAEGAGERRKMLSLALKACKFSSLILASVVLPCVFEMPRLIELWLGYIPEYSVEFCRIILIASLVDQLSLGLAMANNAVGKIRNYALIVNTIKLLTVPAIFIGVKSGISVYSVMWFFVVFEAVCAVVRVPFMKYSVGLDMSDYIRNVLGKIIVPILFLCFVCALFVYFIESDYRFLITFSVAIIMYGVLTYFVALTDGERKYIIGLIKNMIAK